MRAHRLAAFAFVAIALLLGSCGDADDGSGTVIDIDLTAEVVDHEVVEGEVVEIWGYNGQYPGPMIEATVGDTLRINLTNNLPEGTTIHWHGLEVPNDQDGVPGITQPIIGPGQSYTYEFTLDKAGTTMYHTHANTVVQLSRGLVGPLVVREKAVRQSPRYDREYTLVLHEIDGLFTINGHSFPATLEDERSLIKLETGERIRVRMINAGQQNHPMHMHGHQFKVISLDGNDLDDPYWLNTIDIAPGQTADVEVVGNNPGTWTFHCHILPHVTNRGQYPGGMLTLVDYEDHTSFFEGAPAPQQPETAVEPPPTTTTTAPAEVEADRRVEVTAAEFAFSPDALDLGRPGDVVRLVFHNDGAVLHDLSIPDLDIYLQAQPGTTTEIVFTVPDGAPGTSAYFCTVAGHREAGMEGVATTE